MPVVLAVALSLLLGSPVTGALTIIQGAALAGMVIKGIPEAIKLQKQLDIFLRSPSFRAWVAANGEGAIRLRPGMGDS